MPRYFLHIRDFNGDLLEDEEGAELPSLAAAREEATLVLREFLAAAIREGREPPIEMMVIDDEDGKHLAAVPLIVALPSIIVNLLVQPEKVIPADRFEEYRLNADVCRGKAEDAVDPDDKSSWLKLADGWLQMLPKSVAVSDDLAGWPKVSDEDSKASH